MGISIEQYRSAVGLYHGVHLRDIVQDNLQTSCVHPSDLNNDLQGDSCPNGTGSKQDENTPMIISKKCLRNVCFRYRPKAIDVHAKVPISRIESDCTYFTSLWFLQCYIYMIYTGRLVEVNDFEDQCSYFVSLWFLESYLHMLASGKLCIVGNMDDLKESKRSVRGKKGTVLFDELNDVHKVKRSRRKEKKQSQYFASVWILQLYLDAIAKYCDSPHTDQSCIERKRPLNSVICGFGQSPHFSDKCQREMTAVTLVVCFVLLELLLANDIETNPGPGKSNSSNVQTCHRAIVPGTFHQASTRFSPDSQGRQCTPISYFGILFSSIDSPSTWTTSTIDFLLTKGDIIYNACNKKNSYMDTEELPLVVNIEEKNAVCESTLSPTRSGIFSDKSALIKNFSEWTPNHTGCLFIACSFTVAIVQQGRRFYVLDSHSRHPVTGLGASDGTAVLMMFTSLKDIVNHFWDLYKLQKKSSEQFDIVPIDVLLKPDINTVLPPEPDIDKYLLQQRRLSYAHQSQKVVKDERLTVQGTLKLQNQNPFNSLKRKSEKTNEIFKESSARKTEKDSVKTTSCFKIQRLTECSITSLPASIRKRDLMKLKKEKNRLIKQAHRCNQTVQEREITRVQDTLRKQNERKQKYPIQIDLVAIKDKKRKQKKQDQKRKAEERKKMTPLQKKTRHAKDRKHKVEMRKQMTPLQKEIEHVKDVTRKQKKREQMTPVQKEIEHVKDMKRKLKERKQMTPVQKEIEQLKDIKRKVRERKQMTPVQKQIEQVKDKKRKIKDRKQMTPSQEKAEHLKDMKRKKERRLNIKDETR